MNTTYRTITSALLLLAASAATADKINLGGLALDVSGYFATETRLFANDPRHDGQDDGAQSSLVVQPELRYKSDDGRVRVSVIPYLRLDGRDDERTHFDLREAYWLWLGDRWEVLAGVNKVFWGVAESRHLVDVQYTRDAWLWKLEAIVREGQGETFGAWVAGFEHTFFQVGGGAADLGLLVEHLYDGRDPLVAPPTLYDDDVFLGARLALNDTRDTSVLAGVVVDSGDRSTAAFVEAERRLGRGFKVEVEGRFFFDAAADAVLGAVADDDVLTLRLARHF